MYTLNWSTTISSVIDAQSYGLAKNTSFQVSSSNALQQTLSTLTGSMWSAISTGSLSNIFSIGLYNDNNSGTGSIIQIATGSGGQNVITTLQPGQSAIIPWSGSLNGLYGTVVGSPNIGVLQYYLQQA